MDPLRIDKMDLIQGEESPVNIKMNFRNISMLGLSNARVYKISGFNRNSAGDKLEIRFKSPKIAIVGPYKSIGKVLILPIQGEGNCNMTLGTFRLTFFEKAMLKILFSKR